MGYVLVSYFKGYSIFPVKLTSFPASEKIDSINEIDSGPIEPTPLHVHDESSIFTSTFLIHSS